MLTNMSKFDRKVRFVTGAMIWVLYLTESMVGGFAHFLAVVGVIFLSTSIMNYCPYYLVCNTSTNKDSRI